VRLLPIKNDLHGYAFMKTLRLLAAALLSAGLLNIATAQVSASVAKPLKEASDLLHAGERRATIWTTDLTYDYVRENAEYST